MLVQVDGDVLEDTPPGEDLVGDCEKSVADHHLREEANHGSSLRVVLQRFIRKEGPECSQAAKVPWTNNRDQAEQIVDVAVDRGCRKEEKVRATDFPDELIPR